MKFPDFEYPQDAMKYPRYMLRDDGQPYGDGVLYVRQLSPKAPVEGIGIKGDVLWAETGHISSWYNRSWVCSWVTQQCALHFQIYHNHKE